MAEHLVEKPEKLVAAAAGFLEQSLTIPNTFVKEGLDKFQGADGDAYSVKVPGVLPFHTYAWRNDRSTSITYDTYSERKVTVTFGDMKYNGVKMTDEQKLMDMAGWSPVLEAQVRAVGRGVQYGAVDHLTGADYAVTIGQAEQNLRGAVIEARRVLNKFNVPDEQRWLLVGTDFEAALLGDGNLNLAQNVGDEIAASALTEAFIGRRYGFNIIVDNSIPSDQAFAYVRSAFVMVTGAPPKPTGAAFGASTSYEGIALSWVCDYDPDKQQDRSVVKTFPGFRSVDDPLVGRDSGTGQEFVSTVNHFVRGIKLDLTADSVYPASTGTSSQTELSRITGVDDTSPWAVAHSGSSSA